MCVCAEMDEKLSACMICMRVWSTGFLTGFSVQLFSRCFFARSRFKAFCSLLMLCKLNVVHLMDDDIFNCN